MKKRCLWPGIFALAGVLLTSCFEESNEIGPNKIQIYGVDYELRSGVLWHSADNRVLETQEYVFTDHFMDADGNPQSVESKGFTVGENSRSNGNFLLSLYDQGLSLNPDLLLLRGKGTCICFHLASPDKQHLAAGTYTWGDKKEDFTYRAFYSSAFNPEELKTAAAEIKEGKVTVSIEGEEYMVDFDCKTDFGAIIKGTYQGHLATYQIENEDIAIRTDVKIQALLDSIKSVLDMYMPEEYGGHQTMDWTTPGPDFYQGEALYSVMGGIASTVASASGNENMELALVYNRASESVFFESPIKMCVWLHHQYSCDGTDFLTFPCHTRYMKAPQNFTEEDFDKITQSSDLDFVIEGEPRVEISLSTSQPEFIFFETGKGMRGVIKVKDTTPFKVSVSDFSEMTGGLGTATLTSNVNPSIITDIKYVSSVANMKIR